MERLFCLGSKFLHLLANKQNFEMKLIHLFIHLFTIYNVII